MIDNFVAFAAIYQIKIFKSYFLGINWHIFGNHIYTFDNRISKGLIHNYEIV